MRLKFEQNMFKSKTDCRDLKIIIYKTILKSVITIVLKSSNNKERKQKRIILRKIYGLVVENGMQRIKRSNELQHLCKKKKY